ncbi:MAG TPA: hypothetical protein VNL13_01120 [Sulfolobales archaeon]|nr:hypothetical protein [Sulfolobales archaeon]
MGRKTLPIIALLSFFLVGVPILVSIMVRLGIDRGAVSDFIEFCASLLGINRVGVAGMASEIMLTIALIGGVAVAILYIYETVFGEEGADAADK